MRSPVIYGGLSFLLILPSTATSSDLADQAGTLLYKSTEAYQSGGTEGIKLLATNEAVAKANESIANATSDLSSEGFKTFDLGLTYDDGKAGIELLSVYGISETDTSFLFNQSSILNYDSNTAVNIGLGYRALTSSKDTIVGVNGFYDHELGSNHNRLGLGVEWFNDQLSFRSNYYKAMSGNKLVDGFYEEALDGVDYKISYYLPISYPVEIFAEGYTWSDSTATQDKGYKLGFSGNIGSSSTYSLAYDRNDDGTSSTYVSFTSSIGNSKSQIGYNLKEKLYQPVERENRIKKKTTSRGGITVSGF